MYNTKLHGTATPPLHKHPSSVSFFFSFFYMIQMVEKYHINQWNTDMSKSSKMFYTDQDFNHTLT